MDRRKFLKGAAASAVGANVVAEQPKEKPKGLVQENFARLVKALEERYGTVQDQMYKVENGDWFHGEIILLNRVKVWLSEYSFRGPRTTSLAYYEDYELGWDDRNPDQPPEFCLKVEEPIERNFDMDTDFDVIINQIFEDLDAIKKLPEGVYTIA